MTDQLQSVIEQAWDERDTIDAGNSDVAKAVADAVAMLDSGKARVAEKSTDGWVVNQWLKKAVLLSFRLNPMTAIPGGPGGAPWWDKVDSKFLGWDAAKFKAAGFRAVPGAIVRKGSYIAPGAVLMPSFVNIGAYVGEGTMVDTWATVGSCAQIGRNVHISGGTGIGGVLEPLQAGPVIIEDDCFIGARSEVAEGVVVEQGAVISMGVFLGASTKIVDRVDRRSHLWPGTGLFGRRSGYAARQRWRTGPGLRRHRQARRRTYALQDQHQRAASRLALGRDLGQQLGGLGRRSSRGRRRSARPHVLARRRARSSALPRCQARRSASFPDRGKRQTGQSSCSQGRRRPIPSAPCPG